MNETTATRSYPLIRGTLWTFLAESMILPTGLITAAILTRTLQPDRYGLLVLMGSILSWIEWSISAVFTRTTVKLISEAQEWQPLSARVIQLNLGIGLSMLMLIWLLAGNIAALLHEPRLAANLRLFAVEIPIVVLSQALRNILIGLGRFYPRAIASSTRWIGRMTLIIACIPLGLSIQTVILIHIASALLEALILLVALRPRIFIHSSFPTRLLLEYALPITFAAVGMRLYEKIDILLLKALKQSTLQAGYYGVAQNLAIIPAIFSLSFTPILISTISNALAAGAAERARNIIRHALRLCIGLLPFGALVAGAAGEMITLLFSQSYLPAVPALRLLLLAGFVELTFSVSTAILVALGRPGWTAWLSAFLLLSVISGHFIFIPRYGITGAAAVSAGCILLSTLAAFELLRRCRALEFPMGTLLRSLLISSAVYAAAARWDANGPVLILKFALLGLAVPVAYGLLGEFKSSEIQQVKCWVAKSTPHEHR